MWQFKSLSLSELQILHQKLEKEWVQSQKNKSFLFFPIELRNLKGTPNSLDDRPTTDQPIMIEY